MTEDLEKLLRKVVLDFPRKRVNDGGTSIWNTREEKNEKKREFRRRKR